MTKLISLFASVLMTASLFASSAYALGNSQMTTEQVVYNSAGGKYHQCFVDGNPGCK